MVVDVRTVKQHIKPKEDSTLYNMRKCDLIEYVRTLEHNYNVAVSFNENQAKYIESLDVSRVVHGRWIKDGDVVVCSNCGEEHSWDEYRATYCEDCGAKMDGGSQ